MSRRAKALIDAGLLVVAFFSFSPGVVRAQTAQQAPARPAWMEAGPTSTGIDVGKKVPAFQLADQNGKQRDFTSLRGPKGLALYFMRSADW